VLEQLHPVALGQDEVGDDHLELGELQGFLGLGHRAQGGDLVPGAGQKVMVQHSGDLLVVDQEDLRHSFKA